MSTGNFYSNENGIYSFGDDTNVDELKENIMNTLAEKGYRVTPKYDEYVVTKNDMVAAALTFVSGYYEGGQVIVTTDKDKLEDRYAGWAGYQANFEPLQWYTKYHKRILKVVEAYTKKLSVVARFDNGETIYNGRY